MSNGKEYNAAQLVCFGVEYADGVTCREVRLYGGIAQKGPSRDSVPWCMMDGMVLHTSRQKEMK